MTDRINRREFAARVALLTDLPMPYRLYFYTGADVVLSFDTVADAAIFASGIGVPAVDPPGTGMSSGKWAGWHVVISVDPRSVPDPQRLTSGTAERLAELVDGAPLTIHPIDRQ